MKRIIAKQTHYKSLINAIKRHPEFVEGKAQIQRMVSKLESREKRISEILSDISRPVSIFYSVKRQAENEMNESMFRFTNLGKLSAYHKQDEMIYTVMKTYQEQLQKVSTYKLYLNAVHTAELLQTLETKLTGSDFHSRQLPEFCRQTEVFGTKLTALSDQLLQRKALKKELAELNASTNLLLRNEMDHAVNYFQELYPDFYREYHLIRQPHERKRRSSKQTQPEMQETMLKKVPVNKALAPIPEPVIPLQTKLQLIEKPVGYEVPHYVKVDVVHETEVQAFENDIPASFLSEALELIFATFGGQHDVAP